MNILKEQCQIVIKENPVKISEWPDVFAKNVRARFLIDLVSLENYDSQLRLSIKRFNILLMSILQLFIVAGIIVLTAD